LADDNQSAPPEDAGQEGAESPEILDKISLEQALLAPLDAIFKAQLHSARSFLNMLLQLGYPHDEKMEGKPWPLQFRQDVEIDGEVHEQTISVPALSLVPIAPLAVSNAEFQLELAVREITSHTQMQAAEARQKKVDRSKPRPWFLVDKPINIQGMIAPPDHEKEGDAGKRQRESAIKIAIKVNSIPMPRGLDKLLTSLTETAQVQTVLKSPGNGSAPAGSQDSPKKNPENDTDNKNGEPGDNDPA